MFKFIVPVILIGAAVAGFFLLANPIYEDIKVLRGQVASYDEALENSKALESERDKLAAKYNSINPQNLDRLSKFLPNNVDNIRLILEIENLAGPYGMVLKDVKYSTQPNSAAATGVVEGGVVPSSNQTYGSWDLEFSVQGRYGNFLSFLRDLENNLRIVDVASIDFTSPTGESGGASPNSSDIYKYSFKIKTYWLKN